MTITTLYVVVIIVGVVAGIASQTSLKYSLGVTFGIVCLSLSIMAGLNYSIPHSLGILGAGCGSFLVFLLLASLLFQKKKEKKEAPEKHYQFKADQPSRRNRKRKK